MRTPERRPSLTLFDILHESDGLLVLRKPAGLVCHPTKAGPLSSLVSRVRIHLGREGHMVHRLDRETGGVMVFATTDEAGLEIRRHWEGGFVTKEYTALVHGRLPLGEGLVDAPLGRDEHSTVAVRDRVRTDGSPARTRWRCLGHFERAEGIFSVVRVRIDTGRKHQIRIHLAHLGHPVVGDKIYGPDERIYLDFVEGRLPEEHRRKLILPYQALHAERLWFPWNGEERLFEAPPEAWFRDFALGRPVPWFDDPYAPDRQAIVPDGDGTATGPSAACREPAPGGGVLGP
jgi:23S rRNA pseudouridine1911/1915/1917 synthase